MNTLPHIAKPGLRDPILVIGAGMGGLAAALPLVNKGLDVTVIDRATHPGGKARKINGVDAGPTVLTMRPVFEALFNAMGETLEDHVTLHRQSTLARHWWPDGSTLDLFADPHRTRDALQAFGGQRTVKQFDAFTARTKALFDAFRAPMMESADPDIVELVKLVASKPTLLRGMAPGSTLSGMLNRSFSDPRLRQLFGRYATYVGGSPYLSPALLALIWQAEEAGVWVVEGGIQALAKAMANLFVAKGGRLRMHTQATRVLRDGSGVTGVALRDGSVLRARTIVFNGDPRALALGLMGEATKPVATQTLKADRSLSAHVWAFSSKARGLDLAHHNVFFCDAPRREFKALEHGHLPQDTTLYICAEDRGLPSSPPEDERFEIILNAPPLTKRLTERQEFALCHQRTFPTLERFGLSFDQQPTRVALTTPAGFDTLFPGSAGSLYGQSPHGMTAALQRPRARTSVPGLYLAGGGCHPGAGVPMAALSGRHAAEAILTDQTFTSTSRPTATRGGMSTPSPIAEQRLYRSSDS